MSLSIGLLQVYAHIGYNGERKFTTIFKNQLKKTDENQIHAAIGIIVNTIQEND